MTLYGNSFDDGERFQCVKYLLLSLVSPNHYAHVHG